MSKLPPSLLSQRKSLSTPRIKGMQTGVDRLGRHICWDNISGHRLDCPEVEDTKIPRTRQPTPEPGEHQPLPQEDEVPPQGQVDPTGGQAARVQQQSDLNTTLEILTRVLSCSEFIVYTTTHLLKILSSLDPMEREWFKGRLMLDGAGQQTALQLAESSLPEDRGEVIQISTRDPKPRGQHPDLEYMRSKVVQIQECGGFVLDTTQEIIDEVTSLQGDQLASLQQNIGLNERRLELATLLATGALQSLEGKPLEEEPEDSHEQS